MAAQLAQGNHDVRCSFCNAFISKEEFTQCNKCGRAVRNWRA